MAIDITTEIIIVVLALGFIFSTFFVFLAYFSKPVRDEIKFQWFRGKYSKIWAISKDRSADSYILPTEKVSEWLFEKRNKRKGKPEDATHLLPKPLMHSKGFSGNAIYLCIQGIAENVDPYVRWNPDKSSLQSAQNTIIFGETKYREGMEFAKKDKFATVLIGVIFLAIIILVVAALTAQNMQMLETICGHLGATCGGSLIPTG